MQDPIESHIIREEVKCFLADRRARQLSERTLEFYAYHLDVFLQYCKKAHVECMEQLSTEMLRELFGDFGKSHNKGGTHALYRTMRTFFIWFENETDGAWRSPLRKIQPPKIKQPPIPGVSQEDVKCLVSACGKDWCGRRDRALLLFLFDTGLRRNECFNLNLGDIDLDSGTVKVRSGKGGKSRVAFFGEETAAALRRYLRGRSNDPNDAPLWLNQRRKRIGDSCLRDLLRRRAADCGIKEVPSAHDFRRGFALNMLRNGADLLSVSRLLGHEGLEVTRRYLALVESDLKQAHMIGGPVSRMTDTKGAKNLK